MAAPSPSVAADDGEYEICVDDGFVYKRRRGLYPDVAPPSAPAAGPDPEAARRRRRRDALLRLRDKRLRELERWEALEEKLHAQLPIPGPPPPQAPPACPDPATATASASSSVLDYLLAQAEVEEAILEKVAGLCDQVDALCRPHEEDVVDAITALPVWGDPKELLTELQTPDVPGDLDFRKDCQNDGNGSFQSLDSRQFDGAIYDGSYDGCQEAAGVSPALVQSITDSGKTMKRGPYQGKRCFQTGPVEKTFRETPVGLGDDPSIFSEIEKRKKKGAASHSDSRSVKTPKQFYQSTPPNPVSSHRPTARLSSGRLRNLGAS